jgi:excisionase family DNA binding protein
MNNHSGRTATAEDVAALGQILGPQFEQLIGLNGGHETPSGHGCGERQEKSPDELIRELLTRLLGGLVRLAADVRQPAPLLTYEEAAELLRVTSRTVWSLADRGKLPAVRFGGNVRIDPLDLRNFIESRKQRCRKGGSDAQ